MTTQSTDRGYARQVQRITQALAVAKNDMVTPDIAVGLSVELVDLFTAGNLDKRFDKLRDQVELLEDGFPNLDKLIEDYVATVPLAAYDTGSGDGDRFAQWVMRQIEATAEQRDLLAVVRSRYMVEEIARHNRLSHVRFQERLSLNERLLPELTTNDRLRLYLNPIRLVAHFESGLFLGDDERSGADSVFFAVGTEIRVAVLDDDGHRIVAALAERVGLSLADLSGCVETANEPSLLQSS